MTLGVDVSPLFADMCLISQYPNTLSKKMIYLYLENYAEINQSLALLAINTFIKECSNPDLKIRGLALRSLCGLRSHLNSPEVKQQVVQMLNDNEAYVQKTAVYGCLKIYRVCSNFFEEFNLINQFYNMLKSPFAVVVVSVINVLNEVLEEQQGMTINSKIVSYLLNRLKDFGDYGSSVIFELIARYPCKDENEVLFILNILDTKLKSANSNLVFCIVKVFLCLTKNNPELYLKVFDRFKESLITMLLSTQDELKFNILCHVFTLIKIGGSRAYEKDYKRFFCDADDKSYNQEVKLKILECIVTNESFDDIFNELCQYINEISVSLAQKSLLVVGKTAVKFPERLNAIFALFNSTLRNKRDFLCDSILVAAKHIYVNCKPDFSKEQEEFFESFELIVENVHSESAKEAFVWLVSKFAEKIENASYLVEKFVNDWTDTNAFSDSLKLEVF